MSDTEGHALAKWEVFIEPESGMVRILPIAVRLDASDEAEFYPLPMLDLTPDVLRRLHGTLSGLVARLDTGSDARH